MITSTRRHAFTAVVQEHGFMLGRADEGVQDYTPVPGSFFTSYEEARKEAHRRNEALGLGKMEAFEIISSTMRR